MRRGRSTPDGGGPSSSPMQIAAPQFSVIAVECFERPVRLRLPFRFGAVTLNEAIEAFVRARIRLSDGRESIGATAELMIPKWFDKDPARSNAENVDQLRLSLALACEAYTADATPRLRVIASTAVRFAFFRAAAMPTRDC